MYITDKAKEIREVYKMNMTELLAISNSNLSLEYDTRTQILSLSILYI